MSDLKLYDRVVVPLSMGRIGVISFISECGKYVKVKYDVGKKKKTVACKISDLKKVE